MAKTRFMILTTGDENEFDEQRSQVGVDFEPRSAPSQKLPIWVKVLIGLGLIWAIVVLSFFGLVINSFF